MTRGRLVSHVLRKQSTTIVPAVATSTTLQYRAFLTASSANAGVSLVSQSIQSNIPDVLRSVTSTSSLDLIPTQSRKLSTVAVGKLPMVLYQSETTKVITSIADRMEAEDVDNDDHPTEVNNAGDVLTIKNSSGTWVLNKHNVTKQLWFSSPKSGPSKYSYVMQNGQNMGEGGVWVNERDGTSRLSAILQSEFSTIYKKPIEYDLEF